MADLGLAAATSADFAEVTASPAETVASMEAAIASMVAATASMGVAIAYPPAATSTMAQAVGITVTAQIGAGITAATVTRPDTITGIIEGATITTVTPTTGGRGTTGTLTGTLTRTDSYVDYDDPDDGCYRRSHRKDQRRGDHAATNYETPKVYQRR